MNKEKIISIVVVVLVVAGVAGFALFGKGPEAAKVEGSVAKVNGVEITRTAYDEQLALAINAYKGQGIDVDNAENLAQIKTQVLDDLINNELVTQGIAAAGIKITDAQVEEQVQILVTQAGDMDKLKEQLVISNLTEEQLRTNISRQLAVQAYLAQNIDMASVTVSDAEVTQFYNDNVKGQEGAPSQKELEDQIKQQIISNKQQLLINTFIASLRGKSEVETTL